MKQEPKYITLDEVVSDYLKKGVFVDGKTYYDACMNNIQQREQSIITEDAEFEVVQPKQIENNKD